MLKMSPFTLVLHIFCNKHQIKCLDQTQQDIGVHVAFFLLLLRDADLLEPLVHRSPAEKWCSSSAACWQPQQQASPSRGRECCACLHGCRLSQVLHACGGDGGGVLPVTCLLLVMMLLTTLPCPYHTLFMKDAHFSSNGARYV